MVFSGSQRGEQRHQPAVHTGMVITSERAREDSPAHVWVFPFEGARGFRLGSDVAQKLAREILDRCEGVAGDDFAL